MGMYPDVQQKAQEEINRVIGSNRLPQFEDRQRPPYVDAVVKEVLRWHPVAPMGFRHMSSEADMCHGYYIPKGALIIANIWGFMHDPNRYCDLMRFHPERFLSIGDHNPEPDPHLFVFGFGRRKCPGNILADATIFLTMSQSLAVFNIGRVV
ncbi:unnamed protein product [Penicillium egyptiacum]|uniref:Cytochrome P450 n=1 Tax=Penicillium egyptiacum TaxID=1303716 RepID=A0A9W4NZA0_9EURO|nr:unnamed protein product [Penicillium egyptiacum]